MLNRTLNLLGWLGATLVISAFALLVYGGHERLRYWLAMAGLVCTLAYLLTQWREIGRSFSRRQVRYGAISVGSVLVVLAILVGINWIAARQDKRWDLTAGGQFTISDQTRKILGSLKAPVQVKVFASTGVQARFRDRLTEYSTATDKLKIEYIEPLKQPALANQYDVQSDGTLVFEYGGRKEKTTSDAEQDLTNALVKVVQGQQKKVYFITGHGEKDIASSDRPGYSGASQALKSDNFTVEKVVLAQQSAVPSDAGVVIVAGPRTDHLPAEIDMLKAYLRKGGKLLMMLDPPENTERPPLANLIALARDWGIDVGTNVVVDLSPAGRLLGTGPSVPVAASYPSHPITERLQLLTAYPLARSVSSIAGGVNGHNAQNIVETSPNSWAETDIKALATTGEARREEDKGDKPGPISLAAAVTHAASDAPQAASGQQKAETRVVVFGDSDFASNVALGVQGNRDLFLNTVNWLAQQENMIAIRPRQASDRRVTMTAAQTQRVFWLSVVIIPGLIILAGVQAWWRRR